MGFGAVTFSIIAAVSQLIMGDIAGFFTPFRQPHMLAPIIFLGIGSTLLNNVCANYATTKLEAPRVAVFNNLAMLVTMLSGALFLDEPLHWFHIAGAVLIILGVVCSNIFASRAKDKAGMQPAEET
jgi:drug/metabolite transporter (DMT)-like permease